MDPAPADHHLRQPVPVPAARHAPVVLLHLRLPDHARLPPGLGRQVMIHATGDDRAGRLTIKDVARDAGASSATVSRVLAGSATFSEGPAAPVRRMAPRLVY